jgi:CheY-like chemotaxis protein
MALPIVALTANAMEDLRLEALNAGANEFATKLIHGDQLHSKCGQYLHEPPSQLTSEVVCSAESSVDLLLV